MRIACLIAAGALAAGTAMVPATTAAAAPSTTGRSWTADLSRGADQVNIHRSGAAVTIADPDRHSTTDKRGFAVDLLAPHRMSKPVSQVDSQLSATVPRGASVAVDVRGRRVDGGWTEWRQASGAATLPAAVTTVQARVTLHAAPDGTAPVVKSLRLSADPAERPAVTPQADTPLTFRVYATREGLVGGTTANGHVIKSRDHFVALPSRRGLSPKGSDQYSVKVCNPSNGKCETAPVWDVGPWNTTDDYWNPSATRQSWQDLPQGKPEAQAAYQDGYNGGRDQFGRHVANPAGIDLADGTFWDGLGMSDNGWVNVTYLWTGGVQPVPDWPLVKSGATGDRVKTIQYLLNQRQSAGLDVDGIFGPKTTAAVKSFQSANGLDDDGIVGPLTWAKLVVTVQSGSTGGAVRAVQNELTAHGKSTPVTGTFDATTEANVKSFQSGLGRDATGVVDSETWRFLVA